MKSARLCRILMVRSWSCQALSPICLFLCCNESRCQILPLEGTTGHVWNNQLSQDLTAHHNWPCCCCSGRAWQRHLAGAYKCALRLGGVFGLNYRLLWCRWFAESSGKVCSSSSRLYHRTSSYPSLATLPTMWAFQRVSAERSKTACTNSLLTVRPAFCSVAEVA